MFEQEVSIRMKGTWYKRGTVLQTCGRLEPMTLRSKMSILIIVPQVLAEVHFDQNVLGSLPAKNPKILKNDNVYNLLQKSRSPCKNLGVLDSRTFLKIEP